MRPLPLPEPAPWLPTAPAPTTLARCTLLAMLLHVLAVLLLGNVPGGSARPGAGVWGAIEIRLRGGGIEKAAEVSLEAPQPTGPAGGAGAPRWGGAVRERTPAPAEAPGTATLGEWAPQAVAPSTPRVPVVPAAGEAAGSVLKRPGPGLDLPRARTLVPSPALESAPRVALPELVPPAALNAPPRAAPPLAPSTPPAATAAAPREVVSHALPKLPDAARSDTATAARAPLPSMPPMPSLPSLAPARVPALPLAAPSAPALATTGTPASLPVIAPPSPPRELLAPPVPSARPQPALERVPGAPSAVAEWPALPSMPPLASGPDAPPAAPPATATTAPTIAPTITAQPVAPLAARTPRAAPTPNLPAPAPELAAAPRRDTAAAAADALAHPAGSSDAPTPPGPVTAGSPRPGRPDAGPYLGHDQATPPADAASAPRLNLELPRLRGGALSGHSARGVLPVLPRPPELKSKLATELEKAAKSDCRDKYAGMGVLAPLALMVDALRSEGGCKW